MAERGGDSGAGAATRSKGEPAYPMYDIGAGEGLRPFEPPTGESSPLAPPHHTRAPSGRASGTGRPTRPIILARWRRLPWRTRSAVRSRPPAGARTYSSVAAGSWMTAPATWPADVEVRTGRLIGPNLGSARWPSRQGPLWRERPPKRGGEVVDFGVHHLPLPGGAPAPKNRGSLPPLPPPPVRRHDAPCEAGTRDAGAARGFTPEDSGNPCQPASNAESQAQPGPRRRGLRPLRVERWGG